MHGVECKFVQPLQWAIPAARASRHTTCRRHRLPRPQVLAGVPVPAAEAARWVPLYQADTHVAWQEEEEAQEGTTAAWLDGEPGEVLLRGCWGVQAADY